jgi:hypothetical protein
MYIYRTRKIPRGIPMTTSPATIHFDPEVLSLIDDYLESINQGRHSRPMSRSALINTVMKTSMNIIKAKMPDMEKFRQATGLEDPVDVHRRFIEEVLPREVHKLTEG